MNELTSDNIFYAFDPDLKPLLTVSQNEPFVLETRDCFSDQLCSEEDKLDSMDWSRINPATGPVFIEGVKPRDILRIDIQRLELRGKSVMITLPGSGALDGITEATTRLYDHSDNVLFLPTASGEVKLPLKPMIGVIGLSPANESIPNGTPGIHGGNMDCALIGEGTSLYLRAEVAGGLFGCGDVHALMGDGEVLVVGAETPARITLSASVSTMPDIPAPFLETEDLYVSIASAKTSDEAAKQAIGNMFAFLTKIAGLNQGDAGRLMTLVGNLRFCQVVDPKMTVRFEFPKSILSSLGFGGICGR